MAGAAPPRTAWMADVPRGDRPRRPGSGPRSLPGSGTRPKPRVLIVEDHDDTREVYTWCLVAAGWQVGAVKNGAEALAVAASFRPDIVVMDLHLPVVDGVEATRLLKEDPVTADVPFVACTSFAHQHPRELMGALFTEVLPKPCSPEELRVALERIVRQQDGEGE